ncbi:hypothetical protein LXL04_038466 [Taraxacum kok-saghyz]
MLFGYPLSFVLTPHFPSQLQVLPLIEERRRRDRTHCRGSRFYIFMLPHLYFNVLTYHLMNNVLNEMTWLLLNVGVYPSPRRPEPSDGTPFLTAQERPPQRRRRLRDLRRRLFILQQETDPTTRFLPGADLYSEGRRDDGDVRRIGSVSGPEIGMLQMALLIDGVNSMQMGRWSNGVVQSSDGARETMVCGGGGVVVEGKQGMSISPEPDRTAVGTGSETMQSGAPSTGPSRRLFLQRVVGAFEKDLKCRVQR